jgi:SM-20-related protein
MSTLSFSLHPALDVAGLAARFRASGRVRVPAFVSAETATALHAELRGRDDWRQALYSGGKVLELDRPTRAAMRAEQRAALDDAVYAAARTGFQFRYETVRVPDPGPERSVSASTDPLAALAAWLSSGPPRELLRMIVDDPTVAFVDAQATAFSPGDFLTGHDDIVAGRDRVAAYVLGLNPVWRAEWGGLLLFHDGDAVAGQVPAMATLDLLRVGQMHSVSEVTRAAAYRRYSVTGWLRRG